MSILQKLTSIFSSEEPDFEHTEFQEFDDSMQNFRIFCPKHWKYEKDMAVIEGAYAVIFHSTKSETTLRVGIDTRLPYGFNEKKFFQNAKDEIESPSAGVVSKACEAKFGTYSCMTTEYTYSDGAKKMRGEKTLFFTGDRIFSLFFTCPVSQYDKLKKTFEYIKDSVVVKPKKMMLL